MPDQLNITPDQLSALWARVDDLGELIANDMHVPSNVDEFGALRAVLRILDPAQSAALDSRLGPDN